YSPIPSISLALLASLDEQHSSRRAATASRGSRTVWEQYAARLSAVMLAEVQAVARSMRPLVAHQQSWNCTRTAMFPKKHRVSSPAVSLGPGERLQTVPLSPSHDPSHEP
ncbi:unnamed protein product, partial [Ectocarpus sp. 13 AM-2016]